MDNDKGINQNNKVQKINYVKYPSPSKHNVHLIIGHGTPDSIRYNGIVIYDPKKLIRILKKEGNTIQQNDIIVFASCELGKGENSFAQRFSKVFKGSLVVASDQIVASDYDSFWGSKIYHFCADNDGKFIVFKNGEEIKINNTLKCIYGSNSVMSNLISLETL